MDPSACRICWLDEGPTIGFARSMARASLKHAAPRVHGCIWQSHFTSQGIALGDYSLRYEVLFPSVV